MRILVSPQEFKGSLSAREAALAMAAGLRAALGDVEVDLLPMADGGPGTLDALLEATSGRFFEETVLDPLGRPRRARWGALADIPEGPAVVEMAEASGLSLLHEGERDPRRTTTFGTGELLRAAADSGYRRIIVGVGGSATNDGGAGALQALGVRLMDEDGEDLPRGGASLSRLAKVDLSSVHSGVGACEIVIAADVTNPLCGGDGASFVYGPQKGADTTAVLELEAALNNFALVIKKQFAVDVADVPGAGAAGGLAYGLIALCNANVQPGFDVVASAVDFVAHVASADVVITGEGRLDRQSGFGKTTAGVARVAREGRKPVIAFVGSVLDDEARRPFDAVFALDAVGFGEPRRRARQVLERTVRTAAAELLRSGLFR